MLYHPTRSTLEPEPAADKAWHVQALRRSIVIAAAALCPKPMLLAALFILVDAPHAGGRSRMTGRLWRGQLWCSTWRRKWGLPVIRLTPPAASSEVATFRCSRCACTLYTIPSSITIRTNRVLQVHCLNCSKVGYLMRVRMACSRICNRLLCCWHPCLY